MSNKDRMVVVRYLDEYGDATDKTVRMTYDDYLALPAEEMARTNARMVEEDET